jgi:ribonuclease HII
MLGDGAESNLGEMTMDARDLLEFERELVGRGEVVAGIDEVGRGALAGPMLVGAVSVHTCAEPPEGLDDSKRLSATQRTSLVDPLQRWAAEWSLGVVSVAEIDEWGMRLALAVGATRALQGLRSAPTHVLVDGPLNLLTAIPEFRGHAITTSPALLYETLPVTTIIDGDQKSAAIAAAAVLAKVARDSMMVELDRECSDYGWERNKGYGVPEHLDAIRRIGVSIHHRISWNLPERALF